MQVLTTALPPRSQVSRAAFEELGGFTEDVGVGHEDWELWALAVLRGYVLQVSATECHRVPPSAPLIACRALRLRAPGGA
jgi:hypothetical protein